MRLGYWAEDRVSSRVVVSLLSKHDQCRRAFPLLTEAGTFLQSWGRYDERVLRVPVNIWDTRHPGPRQ